MAMAMAVAFGVAGCGAKAPSKADLAAVLETSGIPPLEARCAAAAILNNATTAEIEDVMQRGGSALVDDPDRTDDSSNEVRGALAVCRDQAASVTSTTAPADAATSTLPPASSTVGDRSAPATSTP